MTLEVRCFCGRVLEVWCSRIDAYSASYFTIGFSGVFFVLSLLTSVCTSRHMTYQPESHRNELVVFLLVIPCMPPPHVLLSFGAKSAIWRVHVETVLFLGKYFCVSVVFVRWSVNVRRRAPHGIRLSYQPGSHRSFSCSIFCSLYANLYRTWLLWSFGAKQETIRGVGLERLHLATIFVSDVFVGVESRGAAAGSRIELPMTYCLLVVR